MSESPNFNNTQIAFMHSTTKDLKRAAFLFSTIKHKWMVAFGKHLINIAVFIRLPIGWIIKPTVFKHFCGGETINECNSRINRLAEAQIKTILDYSAEGANNEKDFEYCKNQILQTIRLAAELKHIPFAVFKVTGLADSNLLEKMSTLLPLTAQEQIEADKMKLRINEICHLAAESGVAVLIDAEESWIQRAIDDIAYDMMRKFNIEEPIVYNTLQMYRTDRLEHLQSKWKQAQEQGFFLGFKLVRGAYWEKENAKASEKKAVSPVYQLKSETDSAFNEALKFCFNHYKRISICLGTHNEDSNLILADLIQKDDIEKASKAFYFAQLLGMSDHISYNLAEAGYNVAKYVPYGPVSKVMPYLIRRAEENTAVAGQTGRELLLLKAELKRRKQETTNA